MTVSDKIFYNESSANQLGWDPSWFNCDDFDEKLIQSIKEFQKNYLDLKVDGCCGPDTFRRVYTLREALFTSLHHFCENKEKIDNKNYIICNKKMVEINWNKVVTMEQPNNLKINKGYNHVNAERKIKQFVIHWDAALSSKSCRDILLKRGYSVQFMIDNDGTIYQAVDTNHICWHAPPCNQTSIGVEISNAVYPQYQQHYVRAGFEKRPIIPKQKVHGKYYSEMLGFYSIQVDALKALIKCLSKHYNIPLEVPLNENGELITTVHKKTDKELVAWSGILGHYHLSKNKCDPICLDIKKLIEEIKKEG